MSRDTLAVLTHKKEVDAHLAAFLSRSGGAFAVLPWSQDAFKRLAAFAVAGKTVRGSLVVYTYRLFKTDLPSVVLDAAAGTELIHSGLLIHDDILDRDMIRRRMPTLHSQYEQYAAMRKGTEIAHFGVSQAINIADLAYFLAMRLFAALPGALNARIADEVTAVALAQMQDVTGGHIPAEPYDRNSVLALYRYKTARYTFSLPMMLGAGLAEADARTVSSLESLGESLGILFQIRDDELNAHGTPMLTGKSAGSDAANGKQTLASVTTPSELEKLRRTNRIQAQNTIRALHISDSRIRELMALLRFCEERDN